VPNIAERPLYGADTAESTWSALTDLLLRNYADGKRAILVVDDTMSKRLSIIAALEPLGHEIVEAESGEDALRAVMRRTFAVILMDVQMPEMDGFAATAEIRRRESESPGLARTTIIAITANALEGDPERCLTAGMDDYVSKPLRLADRTFTGGIGTHADSVITYLLPPSVTRFRAIVIACSRASSTNDRQHRSVTTPRPTPPP